MSRKQPVEIDPLLEPLLSQICDDAGDQLLSKLIAERRL
jgi:hypothetical protein